MRASDLRPVRRHRGASSQARAASRPPAAFDKGNLSNAQLTVLASGVAAPVDAVASIALALQRQVGNAAVAKLLSRPASVPIAVVQRDANDIRIKGLFPARKDFPDEIFFDYAKHDVPPDEKPKIEAIAKADKKAKLILQGFASEEGKGGNAAIINQRTLKVSFLLGKFGHGGQRKRVPRQADSEGNIDYRQARRVKIVRPGTKEEDCSASPIVKCGSEVADAYVRGADLIKKAKAAMGGPLASWLPTFQQFYKTADLGVAALVLGQMDALATFVDATSKSEGAPDGEPSGPDHRCENRCQRCSSGFTALTNPNSVLFCPPFFENKAEAGVASDPAELRAHVLLHECCHGSLGAKDLARVHERAFPFLGTIDALGNADSLVGLIRELVTPGQTSKGAVVPDTGATSPQLTEALAFTHKWAQLSEFEANSVYRNGFTIRNEPNGWNAFTDPEVAQVINSYNVIAAEFPPMTPPPAAPTVDDRQRLAAVKDRYHRMADVLDRPVDVASGGVDVVWSPGPGTQITVPDTFAGLPLGDRCRALLRALAKQTDGISAEAVEKYVRMAPLLAQARAPGFTPL